MSIKNLEIKPSEAKSVEIASLPTRPTSSATYGGRGLTAQEMKKAYDAYPALIKERFNALIADLLSGIAINDIPFYIPAHEPFGENIEQTVKGFLDAVGDILDFGTDNARTIFGFVKKFVNDVAKATSLEYDKNTKLLSLTIDGQKKSVTFDDISTLQTNVGTLQTDMSVAKNDITILKDRMELAETDIGTLQTDMSVANDDISNLKESKLDKTGGLISGNLDVAGNLFVNGENYDTTVSSLKDQIDFLSTLLFNTIITNTTVEDTYTSRVTAGGLPVVSNTPTTVHRIAGDTKATENLLNLADAIVTTEINGVTVTADNNKLTIRGTTTAKYFSILKRNISLNSFVGKTLTFSQEPYFSGAGASGAFYWQIHKDNEYAGHTAEKSFTITIEEGHTYDIIIMHGTSTDAVDGTISFMVNEGDTALPYSDYYPDLRSASFKGITSTGSNLVDIYGLVGEGFGKEGVTVTQESDGYLHFSGVPTGNYRVLITLSQDLFADGETYTFAQSQYVGNADKNSVYWRIQCTNLQTGETNYSFMATTTAPGSVTFDKKTYSYRIAIVTGSYAYASGNEMDVSFRFWINLGSTALSYEDYTTDTSFQLAAARKLRKWDYIDVDNQLVVTGTAEVTQETAFTYEELATYPAGYILSADRKTIAYPLETPTTAPLTVPKTYTAWRNGTETLDTGAADALPPTITQTYYEEVTA